MTIFFSTKISNFNCLKSSYFLPFLFINHHIKKGCCHWYTQFYPLFPTQKSTYDKLQEIEGHENDCGRPGVNGGYIDNPNVRFGVNCYGVKPSKPDGWVAPMIIAPKSPCEGCPPKPNKKEEQMNKMKKNAQLAGFNENEWSEF